MNFLLKVNGRRDRKPSFVILECFCCRWEGGEAGRQEKWESSEAGRWEATRFIQGFRGGMVKTESKIPSFCF